MSSLAGIIFLWSAALYFLIEAIGSVVRAETPRGIVR